MTRRILLLTAVAIVRQVFLQLLWVSAVSTRITRRRVGRWWWLQDKGTQNKRDASPPSPSDHDDANTPLMKVTVKNWHAIAQWRWDVPGSDADHDDGDGEGDVCGICRVSYEGCCPGCKMPGDDCPLSALSSSLLFSITSDCCRLGSLGRMQPRLSYALSFEVDPYTRVKAPMSYGPSPLGYVLALSIKPFVS